MPKQEAPCSLVLVRHAESKGSGTFVGQNDEPLSARGRKQLKELATKLSRFQFHAAYASDLKRAQSTALAATQSRRLEIQVRPRLREMHFGRWQGLSWEQITKRHARIAKLWLKHFPAHPIPDAERLDQFKKRVKAELNNIVNANQGRFVLIVTHAGVIRVALAAALGMSDRNLFRLEQANCAINVIHYFASGAVVGCVNG